jgi:hypothetical protein
MIHLKINKKKGTMATDWDEMTILQAVNVMAVELPESVQADITDTALWYVGTDGYKYAAKVFEILSTFDTDDIQHTNAADIMMYFVKYHLQMVIDLHSQTPSSYQPIGIKHFELERVKYKLPESLVVESDIMTLHSAKAVDFIESSNILSVIADMKQEGIKHLPLFIACYCRPEGEAFNEKLVHERAKAFNQLPMSVAWEVFFCIQRHTILFTTNILRFTTRQARRLRMRLRVRGWIAGVIPYGFTRLRRARSAG